MPADNTDQADYWNSAQGQKWVLHQASMDRLLHPVLEAVLSLTDLRPGERVLDIGCGSGTSTIAAAKQVGPDGAALGVDISVPLLDAARQQAAKIGLAQLSFTEADAATADLGQAAYDVLMSRFGVMFFADPVTAFQQMTRALTPDGRIAFACWGRIEANPWFVLPAQAAKAVLGSPEKSDPDAPGPFSMRDIDKLHGTLTTAGLQDIQITRAAIDLAPPGDLRAVTNLSCKIGPAARTLAYFSAGPEQERAVAEKLGDAFAPYLTPQGIRIPAEINMVSARV